MSIIELVAADSKIEVKLFGEIDKGNARRWLQKRLDNDIPVWYFGYDATYHQWQWVFVSNVESAEEALKAAKKALPKLGKVGPIKRDVWGKARWREATNTNMFS